MSKAWKYKLSRFYGRSYNEESVKGGLFVIATGEFLKGYALRSFSYCESLLDFSRTDGSTRRTAKGKQIEEANRKQFYDNLSKLGIVYIGPDTPFENWKRIAYFFSNDTAPKLKRAWEREEWLKSSLNG